MADLTTFIDLNIVNWEESEDKYYRCDHESGVTYNHISSVGGLHEAFDVTIKVKEIVW